MLIIDTTTLLAVQAAIVSATHGIRDQNGQRVSIGTIESKRLEMAALCAVQTATGEVVWPADKPIEWPDPKQEPGPFRRAG